jgi:thymidylate synthase ThyX
MTIEAKIIADSISPAGIRLTTFQLRYPRFIHAELMTHRVFSRNASSSRAIPVERMIEDLKRDPAMPIYWGSNQKGMQAGEELTEHQLDMVKHNWLHGMAEAINRAEQMMAHGLHKQIANRILEPWAHINVVLTATDFENFWMLRRHKDAQPEMKALADVMFEEMRLTVPHEIGVGEWHLPYVTLEDRLRLSRAEDPVVSLIMAQKVSVARCARVSYFTHDGRQTSIEEDAQLYDRLLASQPLHASPAEHQATPDEGIQHGFKINWMRPELHGNFNGWIQYRKTLPGEYIPG